ncbi:MAG: hypothetical protein KF826_03595 [Xanthobacteraceae bacterium]|nr:hypothetical protein [Xanthobacteraceae bacterium]
MSRRFELFQKALDNNGDPVSGATLEFFVGGSSFGVAKDVYSNADLTTPLPQPISYDSAGNRSADIFCSGALYDVRFTVGSTIVTIANYDPGLAAGLGVTSAVPVEFGGTAANNAATARLNLGAASSAALSSVQDSVTALQVAVATGVNGDGEFGALAALDEISRDELATSFGSVVVQSVDATPYTANSDLSAQIPSDDTTPTVSEGTEILTENITPTSSSNKIRISISGFGQPSGTGSALIMAVFRNSTCVAVRAIGSNGTFANIETIKIDSPATTSQVTYSVRVGPYGVNSLRMNGTVSGRLFGGTAACTMRLEEIEVH